MIIYINNLTRLGEPRLPKMTKDTLLFKDLKWLVEVTRNNLHDELGYFTQNYMGISLWNFLASNGYYSSRIEGFGATQTATKTTLIVNLRELHGTKIQLKVVVPHSAQQEMAMSLEAHGVEMMKVKSLLDGAIKAKIIDIALDYRTLLENIFNNLEMKSEGVFVVGSNANKWSAVLSDDDKSVVLRIKEAGVEQRIQLNLLEN